MPTPSAPGIVAVNPIFTEQEQFIENTFHYHVEAAINDALLEGMADTYIAWFTLHAGEFSADLSLVKVYVESLDAGTPISKEVNVPGGVNGTDTSGPLPLNVTWAVKRNTGLRGRAFRGRVYQPGMSLSQLNAGHQTVSNSVASAIRSNYDGLLTAQLSDNGATEVIYHKSLGTGTIVTEYGFSDLYLDSQRRRLPNHNRHH